VRVPSPRRSGIYRSRTFPDAPGTSFFITREELAGQVLYVYVAAAPSTVSEVRFPVPSYPYWSHPGDEASRSRKSYW
jgi:hypothetical protein